MQTSECKTGRLLGFQIIAVVIVMCLGAGGCNRQQSQGVAAEKNTGDMVPSAPPLPVPIEGFVLYENPSFHFRVQYPAEWIKDEGRNRVSFTIPPREPGQELKEGFNILFDTMTGQRMSLSQYASIVIGGLKKHTPQFQLIESSNTDIDGQPAFSITYTGRPGEFDIQYTAFFIIREELLYVMNFAALPERFGEYRDILQSILSSFQFLS